MSNIYELPSPSTGDAPPSYTVAHPNTSMHDQKAAHSPPSPTGQVQAARFSHTNHTVVDDGGLPEVATPEHLRPTMPASEGLIPVSPCDSRPVTASPDDGMVTPLNLLGEQPDTVDCPFCRRRAQTRVKQSPSYITHVTAGTLFITTLAGAVAPYKRHWNSNITHYCTSCDAKVAYRKYGKKESQAMGTPEHLRVASRFPAAGPSQVGKME